MIDVTKKYTNGEITIVWQSGKCIHSAKCWKGLQEVFNPKERPWIKPENAPTERIISQVNECPSAALSYFFNNEKPKEESPANEISIQITQNGPILVEGNMIVRDHEGNALPTAKKVALCRCGASANKPFCDGAHRKIEFKG